MTPMVSATIDTVALKHNLQRIRDFAPRSRVMAVIKANAYGHGLVAVARALDHADAFAVARVDEGLTLRAAGIQKRTVLLEGVFDRGQLDSAAAAGFELVVHTQEQIELLRDAGAGEPFRVWLKLGRCVRKGEHGIRIAARVTPKKAEPGAEQTESQLDKRPVRFTTVSVFGVSQTDPLPGVEQLPLEPPCAPLTGDSHADLLEPLGKLATELGYTVTFEEIAGATGGWCDAHAKRIVVDASQAVNGQVRTLVHELVHALGVNYQTHTRPQAEVIVDTASLIILSGAGLDASGETIPYVAGWGETGALEAVTEHAELIDRLARTVENAIAGDTESPATIAG